VTGRVREPSHGEAGFTLVELLVSLLIFGMLGAAGVALLSFSVTSQGAAEERLRALSQVRRAHALLTADLAQASSRTSRDQAGTVRPAFEGGAGGEGAAALAFVRRGWENYDGAPRSSLQKVEYRLAGGRIERVAFRFVDGAQGLPPTPIIDGVTSLTMRYRDDQGRWRDRWDAIASDDLPLAVEMVATTRANGIVRQLFLVGR
jgi:general secretion pathway protein J